MAAKSKAGKEDVLELYRAFLDDVSMEKLELGMEVPNIFSILGIERKEIRYSNFLAWLCDPSGTHGLGRQFLARFLRHVVGETLSPDVTIVETESLHYDAAIVKREWENIDLLVRIDDLVVCIENKVDSQDSETQLNKYKDSVEEHFPAGDFKRLFVYLTPDGSPPIHETSVSWTLVSYEAIIGMLVRLLELTRASMSDAVAIYITDYVATLKREITMSDDLNTLARQLYKNHEALFKFILQHRTSEEEELTPALVSKLKAWGYIVDEKTQRKGFIYFQTTKLKKLLPAKGKSAFGASDLVFEFDFYGGKDYALVKALIPPGESKRRELLSKWIGQLPNARTSVGKDWLIYFQHRLPFKKEELVTSPAALEDLLNKHHGEINALVEKVEGGVVAHEAELAELK